MNYVGKILPVEGYYVQLNQSLPSDYMNSLIHLYQPLIGMKAIALYQTLLFEIQLQKEDHIQTHHTLMNYLNMPLDQIYEARLQLEGIGLLKTYKKETDNLVYYTYQLMTPFRTIEFFQDIMLSELLYRHVGITKFKQLKEHYAVEKQLTGEDVTVSFQDVFQTFKPTNNVPKMEPSTEKSPNVPVNAIDYSYLAQTLQQQMIDVDKVLTTTNKRIMTQLMQLYDLETYEIEKALLWALTEENKIDVEQLKAACHDLFQAKHNVANVKLQPKQRNERQQQAEQKKPQTKEERLIATLEVISPKQLLEDLSQGKNASEQDMKIVSEVMIEQGLKAPVMNVLVYYVLLQSNMKLTKPYVSKIASHWSRVGLQTAKEAMAFAKEQTKKPQPQRQRRSYNRNRPTQNEVIPDWFKEREKQREQKQPKQVDEQTTKTNPTDEAEMRAILEKYATDERKHNG